MAIGLFDEIKPAGVAGLRILFAALVVLTWRGVKQRSLGSTSSGAGVVSRGDARSQAAAGEGSDESELSFDRGQEIKEVIAFGLALAAMNVSIYLAIDHLPLGTAVAIEFLGPVAVAAYAARSARSWMALALVAGGATLMANVVWDVAAIGVGFAVAAACGWGAYIVLGWRVAKHRSPADGLALSFGVAAIAVVPLVVLYGGPGVVSPRLLALCLVVGLASNVIPYRIDQLVLVTMSASSFALLQAILPVVALMIGVLVLGERPGAVELVGFVAVVAGIALRDFGQVSPPGSATEGT